jgi:type II secretory pathway component PulF
LRRFSVLAYDASGREVRLRREADSPAALLKELGESGLVVVDLKEETAKSRSSKPLSLVDQQFFADSLSAYLTSGLPLAEALDLLGRGTTNRRIGDICAGLRESVLAGRALSAAMRESALFRETLVGMVASGERSASLTPILERAAALFSLELEVRRKVTSAVTYPLAMLTVGLGVVAFLLGYVVPKLTSLFEEIGKELPLPTRILLGLSDVVRIGGLPVLIGAILWFLWRRRSGRPIRIPFFKGIRRDLGVSLVFGQLGALLKTGIPLVQALELTAPVDPVPGRLLEIADQVREGRRFADALARVGGFGDDAVALIRVGETGGDMTGALERASNVAFRRAESSMQRLSSLVEPLVVVIMGALVGFVVVAVLLPVFDLSGLAAH